MVQKSVIGSDPGPHIRRRSWRLDVVFVAVLLASLTATAGFPAYRRSEWPHWQDRDQDCQNTRAEVLIEESLIQVTLSPDGCRVIAGQWLDPYGGEVYTDPRQLDIDHVVPLGAAHRMGGWRWSRVRKAEYANDLSDPEHLIAVSARMNRQKGDRGPAAWLPPRTRSQCRYVRAWQAITSRWALTVSPADSSAMQQLCVD